MPEGKRRQIRRQGGCSLGDEWAEIESGESETESLKRWDFSFEWKDRRWQTEERAEDDVL